MSEQDLKYYAVIRWKQLLIIGTVMMLISICMLFLSLVFSSLLIFFFAIFEIILLVFGVQIFFTALVGREFQTVIECLQASDVHLDMLRMMIRFSFSNDIFHVLYHLSPAPYSYWIACIRLFFSQGVLPDHIQVWTSVSWPVSVKVVQ